MYKRAARVIDAQRSGELEIDWESSDSENEKEYDGVDPLAEFDGMYASDLSGMSDHDSDASEGDEDKAGEIPDYALPKDEVDGDADEEEEDEEEEDEADEEEELSSGSELDEEDLAALLDEEPEKENKFTPYECGTCPGKMLLSLKDEESHLQSKKHLKAVEAQKKSIKHLNSDPYIFMKKKKKNEEKAKRRFERKKAAAKERKKSANENKQKKQQEEKKDVKKEEKKAEKKEEKISAKEEKKGERNIVKGEKKKEEISKRPAESSSAPKAKKKKGKKTADRKEHTSELQSHSFISYAVFCLKKKK
eukprot:TRINITY_DN29018_c0_g1_i1.p1 TRINITY_DN29018_c0_g1~~TRINITY_DN29018_c0_g1_i1.p1  ORF type:complete len:306 (-),score=144.43 TRINITY_DN29018_c0_g1_i1:45-962(-)